jgi:site-specific recombinase XerD
MDYLNNVQKVMSFLKEKRVCSSSQLSHEECYRSFAEYLRINGLSYSADAKKEWLTSIRNTYSRQKYYFWNQYMAQLEEMELTGAISDRNLYQTKSSYEKVPNHYRSILDEYLDSCRHKYSKRSWELATIYCSKIMLFFNDHRVTRIEDISYQDIISLYNADLPCNDNTKKVLFGHAARMLSYFAEKGLCKNGYSLMLDSQTYPYIGALTCFSSEKQAAIENLRKRSQSNSTEELYSSIEDFVDTLKAHNYVGTTLYLARHSLTALYLFLEIHELGYLPDIAWIWFTEIQKVVGISWRHWRRILKCYEEYFNTGDILPAKRYRYEPSLLESLPVWCRESISAFLNRKAREFRSAETIDSYQYPCIRFCKFLMRCEISSFSEITPDVISEFSRTDQHDTFKGRSSYFTVVRQFLEFLEEKNLIHNKSLHTCLSSGTAPVEKIVDVLTDDQIDKINDYRLSHTRPIELRYSAMVMIGLKMGLRASDVVNLKLVDIDWKMRKVDIVQQKTQAQIALPIPIDVGNSIFTYLRDGRPKSSDNHVFIRHNAPYGKLTTKNCTIALHNILPERKAVVGGGFHVTRRTFATRLLRNNAGIETVMDSLGHHDNTSVMKYLFLDEERIKSCALSLSATGLMLGKAGLL